MSSPSAVKAARRPDAARRARSIAERKPLSRLPNNTSPPRLTSYKQKLTLTGPANLAPLSVAPPVSSTRSSTTSTATSTSRSSTSSTLTSHPALAKVAEPSGGDDSKERVVAVPRLAIGVMKRAEPKMRVRWVNHGTRPPKKGRLLTNAKLSFALQHTEWILLEDLLAYGITDLKPNDFVLRSTSFFVATDVELAPKSPVKAVAIKCRWGSTSLERRVSCDVLGQSMGQPFVRPASAGASSSVDAEGKENDQSQSPQTEADAGGWLGWLWSA